MAVRETKAGCRDKPDGGIGHRPRFLKQLTINKYIMEISGLIKSIGETVQVSDKFAKREFVLETEHDKPYPQTILFELHNDRCDMIDAYNEGQEVTVSFNLKGRQHNGNNGLKTYNTLVCWKIQPVNK